MLNLLLRLSSLRPKVRMQSVLLRDLSEALLGELFAMSSRLMAEDLDHFRVHAEANDLVHIFRRADTGAIIGFQFWRTAPLDRPGRLIIRGGKLRIDPAFRRHGLHLVSGLAFYLHNQIRAPRTRYYRLSIASLFGFVSITEALSHYQVFDPRARGGDADAIREAFVAAATENHLRIDEATGLFFVDIFMTPETLDRYPSRYFDRPAARRYASINPDYRVNGAYVGFWFRFTPQNLLSMTQAIRRRL